MVRDPKTCSRLVRHKAIDLVKKLELRYIRDDDIQSECLVLGEVRNCHIGSESGGGGGKEGRVIVPCG